MVLMGKQLARLTLHRLQAATEDWHWNPTMSIRQKVAQKTKKLVVRNIKPMQHSVVRSLLECESDWCKQFEPH